MHAETAIVLLTPAGRSAVASLLVAGPDATERVSRCFVPAGRPLAQQPLDRIAFGRWSAATGGEEVVVCRRAADRVEIHCHGGRAAAWAICSSLVELGCREIAWSDWLRRSAADPIQAEARIALARASTERTALVLWDQHEGSLRRAIDSIAERVWAGQLGEAISRVDALLAWSDFGTHLTQPWKIVIAGPPNAGKSSLINALVGYQRAIVHGTPGTTRDLLTADTAIDGWPIELMDTAGLRTADEPLEAAGIAMARREVASADLVLAVFDRSRPWNLAEASCGEESSRALRVFNKCDLPRHADFTAREGIEVSAVRGDGLDALMAAIVKRLVPRQPAAGEAIPFATGQLEALRGLRASLAADDDSAARDWLAALAQSAAS